MNKYINRLSVPGHYAGCRVYGVEYLDESIETINNTASNLFISEDFYSPTISDEFLSYLHGYQGGIYPRWLAAAVKVLEPRIIVELGNREGLSTAAILSALSDKKQSFYSLDIIKDLRYVSNRAKSDDRFKWIIGDCLDLSIFSRISEIPKNINMLFLDTVHTYEQVMNEFYVWEPLLADQCLVVIDDIRLNDKGKFFDELTHPKYDLTDLCHVSGFGVFFYQRTKPVSVDEAIMRSYMVKARHNNQMVQELYQKLNKPKTSLLNRFYRKLNGFKL